MPGILEMTPSPPFIDSLSSLLSFSFLLTFYIPCSNAERDFQIRIETKYLDYGSSLSWGGRYIYPLGCFRGSSRECTFASGQRKHLKTVKLQYSKQAKHGKA